MTTFTAVSYTHLDVYKRQEIICFTEFECCVILLVEGVEHIVLKIRHRVRIILVHSVIETDKFLKLSLCGDFLDCNSHISYL